MKQPARDHSHIGLSYITHFYCNKPGAFDQVKSLLEQYATYPADLLDRVHFVIVDDGSPLPYQIPEVELNLTWLKITQDIPWNNPGARNLGVTYAKSDKIVLSDIDHEFPVETLHHMLDRPECGRSFFKFRRFQDGEPKYTHANTFLMSRARFLRLWGYDEEFCGHYAHDDVWFVKFQKWHGSRERTLPARFSVTSRFKDSRNATHTLKRDLSLNEKLYRGKRRKVETFGTHHGHSRRFLNFEWKVIDQRSRRIRPSPKPNRLWKPLWWLRLLGPIR